MSTGFSIICLTVYQKFNRTTSVQACALARVLSPPSTPFLESRTQTHLVAASLHAYKVQDTDSWWSEDEEKGASVLSARNWKKGFAKL